MSDLVPHGGDLRRLAERINAEHAEAEKSLRQGLLHAKAAGELLERAKQQCAHGEWLGWLKSYCRFSVRVAQGYMRVASRWPELEAKTKRGSHLSLRQALASLSRGHAESETDKTAHQRERDAALGELGNAQTAGLLRDIDLLDKSRFDLVPTAAETGYATDGMLLVRLSPEEQAAVRAVTKGEPAGRVMPMEKITRVLSAPAGGCPVEVSFRMGAGNTMLRTEDGRYFSAPSNAIAHIRSRHREAQFTLDEGTPPRLRAWIGGEAVALLLLRNAALEPATLSDLQQTLSARLGRILELGEAASAAPVEAGAGNALRALATLRALQAAEQAVEALEHLERLLPTPVQSEGADPKKPRKGKGGGK
jgi:hypothetical protein